MVVAHHRSVPNPDVRSAMASPLQLLRASGLVQRSLIFFAIITAIINGIVTASVGAWLGQTYSSHYARRSAVQGIADLVYERRARAGLVVSSLRRGADIEELRQRKRAYDDVFVEWNKRIQNNILQIRELLGPGDSAGLEGVLQNGLVPALTAMDGCLTRGYDIRIAGQDPMPTIEECRFAALHQFALDCAKGVTDELFSLTRLSLLPFTGNSRREVSEADARARAACAGMPQAPPPSPQQTPAAAAPAAPAPVGSPSK